MLSKYTILKITQNKRFPIYLNLYCEGHPICYDEEQCYAGKSLGKFEFGIQKRKGILTHMLSAFDSMECESVHHLLGSFVSSYLGSYPTMVTFINGGIVHKLNIKKRVTSLLKKTSPGTLLNLYNIDTTGETRVIQYSWNNKLIETTLNEFCGNLKKGFTLRNKVEGDYQISKCFGIK